MDGKSPGRARNSARSAVHYPHKMSEWNFEPLDDRLDVPQITTACDCRFHQGIEGGNPESGSLPVKVSTLACNFTLTVAGWRSELGLAVRWLLAFQYPIDGLDVD